MEFTVLGEPTGKGRPRFSRQGPYVRTYTPEKTAIYENLIKLEYRRQCNDYMFPPDARLDVRIVAYYGIPESASKKKKALMESNTIRPIKKPDIDNIVKCFLDACNNVAYHDDKQVVDLQLSRYYSYEPRVVMTICEATPPQSEIEEDSSEKSS